MSDNHYMTYTITVSLDLNGDTPELVFLDNPYIPLHTVATIVWVIAPNSDPFEFIEFKWCKEGKPLSTPIKRGPVMVTVVCNLDETDIGTWPYRIGVKPKAQPGSVIWSPDCPDTCPHPSEGFKALMLATSGPIIVNTGV